MRRKSFEGDRESQSPKPRGVRSANCCWSGTNALSEGTGLNRSANGRERSGNPSGGKSRRTEEEEVEKEMVPRGKKKVAHFEMQHARSLRVNERSETEEEKGKKVWRHLKVCFLCRASSGDTEICEMNSAVRLSAHFFFCQLCSASKLFVSSVGSGSM